MPSVAWLQITDGDGNLERLYLSPAHKQAAHKVRYLRTSLRHRIAHSGLSERVITQGPDLVGFAY